MTMTEIQPVLEYITPTPKFEIACFCLGLVAFLLILWLIVDHLESTKK